MYERRNNAIFDLECPDYPVAVFEDARTAMVMMEWANRMAREGLDHDAILSGLWAEANHNI